MSGIPQSLNPKTSSLSSNALRNRPQAYWIIYEQEIHKQLKPQINSQSQHEQSASQTGLSKQVIPFQQQTPNTKQKIIKILTNIEKEYSTIRFVNLLSSQITKEKIEQLIETMQKQFTKFKLTKRNLVFSILIPSVSSSIQNFLSSTPYFGKIIKFYDKQSSESPNHSNSKINSPQSSPRKLKFSRKASIIMGSNIFVDIKKSQEEIQQELIKQMKLDFIWLGVLSRLGTDVQKFQQVIIDQEDFTPEYIGFYEQFFEHLDKLIYQRTKQQQQNQSKQFKLTPQELTKLLKQSTQHSSKSNKSISTSTEQLIRSKFNSRIILSDIISTGDYLTLLLSRNYFNLLYIESDTLVRFRQFKTQCQASYQQLSKILDLQTFLTIDDYWYRTFVLKCLPHAKFIIDRGNQQGSYSQVITKNYKQIIPPYRPNFDEYFLSICNVLKQRSGCLKQAVGSIIVKDKRIIATGYNGTPIDCINCFNGGCKVCNNSEKMYTQVLSCTCIHAEYGCILQAGIKITPGSTLYSTKLPCLWCCKLIVQGNISKIVYLKSKYLHLQYENMALAKQILAKASIQLLQVDSTKTNISG